MTHFAELAAATNFSFLHGASHASDMVAQPIALGMRGIGIADRNTVAGVVRAWAALKDARAAAKADLGEEIDFKLAVGARLVFADGTPDVIAYPATRAGWARLCRLLTLGNLRAKKGACELRFDDLLAHLDGLLLIVFADAAAEFALRRLATASPGAVWLGAAPRYHGTDRRRLAGLATLARRVRVPMLATNDPLYATPDDRALQDVLTCVREKTTIHTAGRKLEANAERHLKPPAEMARLFRDHPQALAETQRLLDRVQFDLGQLRYEYPHEPVPEGWTPQGWLEHLTWEAARKRHPDGVPEKLKALLDTELALIAQFNYAYYFLTVHDVVAFAQSKGILCQGRGSAANSAVCYLLGVTSVDPMKHDLLFSRFISAERDEPPDIDVDFEHERREQVMQYIYDRYGRHRAGIVATVIHYRPRSAVREVGKALGLSEDITARLTSTVWGSFSSTMDEARVTETGFSLATPEIARLKTLVDRILHFPRHLSQHVGGFVLTEGRLDEMVPVVNGAMKDRTFIEWDKDDIDALGLMKVDILALGMLTCIYKAFELMKLHGIGEYRLNNIPEDDAKTYAMLQKGDSIGVFQVESRAQINMLPRLKPRELYDLVVQVAIVRPGPIQGDMVHPYLRRRAGLEEAEFPSPAWPHPQDELRGVLGKTFGVPLFQEQAMKLAIVAAKFTPEDANRLRRAMATFRHTGGVTNFETKMVEGMVARGYERDFAHRCFKQIEGFGSYGFPESHALSFALLVYVSSWIKCNQPAVFACAILNSQPMGFYAPAQFVRDAREHGVDVRPIDVNASGWDNLLECEEAQPYIPANAGIHAGVCADSAGCNAKDRARGMVGPGVRRDEEVVGSKSFALRLGFRQIDGFSEAWAKTLVAARADGPFRSVESLARRAKLPAKALRLLADADALNSLGLDRRESLWEVRRTPSAELPLFAHVRARELGEEPDAHLPPMPLAEQVAADYQVTRLSLKAHPMALLRPVFTAERVLTCAEVNAARDGLGVRAAGVVLVRQRPGKGNAIFVTIEDETGIVNALMWARDFEANRRAVMASRLMELWGVAQRSDEGVVHLMAKGVADRSAELGRLSDTHVTEPPLSRADEVLNPQPPRAWHPREVRLLPHSRDFH